MNKSYKKLVDEAKELIQALEKYSQTYPSILEFIQDGASPYEGWDHPLFDPLRLQEDYVAKLQQRLLAFSLNKACFDCEKPLSPELDHYLNPIDHREWRIDDNLTPIDLRDQRIDSGVAFICNACSEVRLKKDREKRETLSKLPQQIELKDECWYLLKSGELIQLTQSRFDGGPNYKLLQDGTKLEAKNEEGEDIYSYVFRGSNNRWYYNPNLDGHLNAGVLESDPETIVQETKSPLELLREIEELKIKLEELTLNRG